jgi:hypothetical protein
VLAAGSRGTLLSTTTAASILSRSLLRALVLIR